MDEPREPFWTAMTPACRTAFELLRGRSFMTSFYLAGGTALALQIGHRVSKDLDWFSSTNRLGSLERSTIRTDLSSMESFAVEAEQDSMMYCRLLGTEVSFVHQHHPLVRPVIDVGGLSIASIVDIGLMKLAAIKDRGTRRDFVDLFCMGQHASVQELIELVETKFADRPDFLPVLARALAYFDDAEAQPMPAMNRDVSWSEVRRYAESGAIHIVRRGRRG